MKSEIKALLVDDHLILREGLKKLLESNGTVRVVASAGSAEEAVRMMEHRTLDVVITDLALPEQSGFWLVEEITRLRPDLRVLVLSISGDSEDVLGALKAGAVGYLTKTASVQELEAAIHSVSEGGTYLQPSIASAVVGALQRPVRKEERDTLSERDREILQLLADGLSNKEIAESLIVSISTIKTQLRGLFAKFEVRSRTELVVAALKAGVISEKNWSPQSVAV